METLVIPLVRLDADLPVPACAYVGDAGVDLRAEENERYEQRRAQAIEPGPVLGENIHVYDRHRNKKQDAEAESQRLDDDVLRGAVRI